MFYMYILKSVKDGQLYIGSTTNLKRRFIEHNKGKVPATRPRIPFILIYYEAFQEEKHARKRESQLKQRGGARYHLLNRIEEN